MGKAKVNEFVEVVADSDELAARVAAALQRRILREFASPEVLRPKQTKKLKKGGSK